MMALGGAAVLAAGLFVVGNFFWSKAGFLSNGSLSSNHARLEASCDSCHVAYHEITDENCGSCHEQHDDSLGVYSFASHYLYRSDDFQKVLPSEREMPCYECHPEHQGREASLVNVADDRCLKCHQFGSFNQKHPAWAIKDVVDDEKLKFNHTFHVAKLIGQYDLTDTEQACLYCHNPEPDGKQFQPLNFDRHCDACHLTTSTSTPRLPIAKQDAPGVVTLKTIQARGEPGSLWSYYVNPNEFKEVAGRVVSKSPVHHKDPWIMANLRRLRQQLYPDAGLADLLDTTPDTPAREVKSLYRESITTLRAQALELRSRPETEIQADLEQINKTLNQLERNLEDPYLVLDETEFPLALEQPSGPLQGEARAEVEALAEALSEPCRTCHLLEKATIARVRKDQTTLFRAEFNHRVHTLQKRCLDCHNRIPIEEYLKSGLEVPAEVDHAGILNLPGQDSCQVCHNTRVTSNNCVTCHNFHPDQSSRSHSFFQLD